MLHLLSLRFGFDSKICYTVIVGRNMVKIQFSENLKRYIHIAFELLKTILISTFIVRGLIPYLLTFNNVKQILNVETTEFLIGLSALLICVLFLTWKRQNLFWWKYKNTYGASKSKFTSVDYVFSIVYFSIVILSARLYLYNDISTSSTFVAFLSLYSLLIGFSIISAYYFPYKRRISVFSSKTPIEASIADTPIFFQEEDLLNRGDFVYGVYREIAELTSNDSFVFGLYGSWGDGKSSVVNLLSHHLDKDRRFIVMTFEPWNFKDEQAILKAFFTTLEGTLSKEYIFPHLRKLLYKYQRLISSGLSYAGIKLNFELDEETVDELRLKIEQYIDATNRKLIIIVDEIDRLQADELSMLFKLVRSTSKFRNSIFLLSLDDMKTIKKLNASSEGILEKVVQKQLTLPKIERTYIDKFVLFSEHKIPQFKISELSMQKVNSLVSISGIVTKSSDNTVEITEYLDSDTKFSILIGGKADINSTVKLGEKIYVEGIYTKDGVSIASPDARLSKYRLSYLDILLERLLFEKKITYEQINYIDREFVFLYRSQVCKLVKNLRDAKLFLNSIVTSLPPIASEISPFDFICLEVIKVFAKDVYNDIFEHWWIYVDERFEGDYINNPFTFLMSSEKNKKNEAIKVHLEELFARSKLSPSQQYAVRKILEQLFPNLEASRSSRSHARNDKRICTTSFEKYFTLKVPSTELPDTFFEAEFKKWNSQPTFEIIGNSIENIRSQGKLLEFLDKLKNIYIDSLEDGVFPVLLDVFAKNINTFSKTAIGDYWNSEYDKCLMLTLKILNSKVAEPRIQDELSKLVVNASDYLFAVDLVLTTKKERGGDLFNIYNNIDIEKLKDSLTKILNKHFITNKKDILTEYADNASWLRILYQWSSNWSDPITPNKDKVTKYIISVFSRYPVKFLDLLKSFKSGFSDEMWNMNYDEYSKVYDLTKLSDLAANLLDSSDLDDNQKTILEKFIDKVRENTKGK